MALFVLKEFLATKKHFTLVEEEETYHLNRNS